MDIPLTLASGTALEPSGVTVLFLSLAVLLGLARLLGEIARRLHQPSVLGEILAGVLLGPTVLSQISPSVYAFVFPSTGATFIALEGLFITSAALLLLVAGLEVDLTAAFRQGKAAIAVSLLGLVIPFLLGVVAAQWAPGFMGIGEGARDNQLAFTLFVGIAVSITALPVIAKILIDLNMFKSDMGMLIMSAATINDVVGWIVFAFILALLHTAADPSGVAVATQANGVPSVGMTITLTIVFLVFMLSLGRYLLHRSLPFVQAHTTWPGGVLSFVLVIALGCAAFTEWIGVHSIFGAFIAGVAMGASSHLRERTRETIHQFITNIFAPLFFASIGLRVNFISAFDPGLILVVLLIACTGKVSGCFLGAKWTGMSTRESSAVGFGMAAQGAMGIILGQLARAADLITDELFVAIIIMALLTSLVSGPMMQKLLRRPTKRVLADLLSDRQFILQLKAVGVREAIAELSQRAAEILDLDPAMIDREVQHREQTMSTGIGNGLAVPHARLTEIKKPMVVIGRSPHGVDFNAPDGRTARLIFLLLTPRDDQTSQIELLRLIATTFSNEETYQRALDAASTTEFLAVLRVGDSEAPEHI